MMSSVESGSVEVKGSDGRELSTASTSIRIVSSSSYLRGLDDKFFLKRVFMALTPASQMPPKCGALGGDKCH